MLGQFEYAVLAATFALDDDAYAVPMRQLLEERTGREVARGALYTTLARGEDRIMVPNSVVLSAAVVPLREPASVDLRARLGYGIKPTTVQAILEQAITVPLRGRPDIGLEEIDGDEVIVRIRATPEYADDGARLADEILTAMSSITDEHDIAVPSDR